MKGEEEGDSDEMMLKGYEGAEGEERRRSKSEAGKTKQKNKPNQKRREMIPAWGDRSKQGERYLSPFLSTSRIPLSSLENLSYLRCVPSGGCQFHVELYDLNILLSSMLRSTPWLPAAAVDREVRHHLSH